MAKSTDAPPHGARRPPPRKRFGQHFLEPAWVARLLDALAPTPEDTFLEIGPGRGALTHPLALRAGRVIAVEIDRDLSALLAAHVPPNVRLVTADVLDLDLGATLAGEPLPVRVVGNLPYNVASPILFRLFAAAASGRCMSDATVMLQKEVADRLTAGPGGRDYGTLAVQAAVTADVERLFVLPPGAFRPPPRVWSAVVRLRFHEPRFPIGAPDVFERIVRGVFLHRRKTLSNALAPVAAALGCNARDLLDRAEVDGTRRPETLSPPEFGRLAAAVL